VKKYMISKPWIIFVAILTPMLVSLACVTLAGGGGSSTDVVFGPGPFKFTDTTAGLSELSSYKATLVLSFDGTKDGQTQQWSRTYIMLTTKEPSAQQLTIKKTGNTSNPDAVFMVEANGADYEKRGENICTAKAIEAGNSLGDQLEPASFLTGVIGAEEAGNETVNEIESYHYIFDEHALGQLDVIQSRGEMWVASEGGYIVKYILTTKGDASHFGEGIEGTLTWDYELTQVNQPVEIKLPEDCPPGMVDAPQLPDTTNILNMPGVLTYDTASSVADAAAFYQKQIPLRGWALVSSPTITDTTAHLSFSKGDQVMDIIIKVGDAGTKVHIVLTKAQK
jgi:hypothetical protein